MKVIFRSLSKSTTIMFFFDLIIIILSSAFCCEYFGFSTLAEVVAISLTVFFGIITLFLKGYYKIREFNVTYWNTYRLFEGVVFMHVPTAIVLFFMINKILMLKFVGLNMLFIFFVLLIYRLCFHFYLFHIKRVKNILIIGTDERAKKIADEIKNKYALKMQVVGFVDFDEGLHYIPSGVVAGDSRTVSESDSMPSPLVGEGAVVGDSRTNAGEGCNSICHPELVSESNLTPSPLVGEGAVVGDSRTNAGEGLNCGKVTNAGEGLDLQTIIKQNKVDIVIVAIKRRMENEILTQMVFGIPRHVKLYKMPDFYEMITGKYYIERMTINWLFYDFMKNRSVVYDFCKRTFDIVAALVILIVTLPITLYTAIRVKLTDGGSPIYTQVRIGRGGKPFKCYKLRTMYKNDYVPKDVHEHGYADNQDDDDRVIPFCKFVRKARFDEIPQMINILKGEMSIVGPRAEWEDLVKLYSEQVPYYPCRMWVRTGWTGWAQINQGHCVTNDDIREKLQYDLHYLKYKSMYWDFMILVKAVFLALGGRHE